MKLASRLDQYALGTTVSSAFWLKMKYFYIELILFILNMVDHIL